MDTADEPNMTCHQVAGSEPSVHEEVIGYIDLNNSGLQLVGGDTFYLQTEALREHILMAEHGKEVQPIIVVVEEGSENVVVQAFSRDSEAVGDEAAFTVNQLDSAMSATLPEQLSGVETITTSEGQQLLILSENANGKLVGMEGTPGEQSAAAPHTEPLFHEGSKGGVPGQCVASLEDSQTELQQGCKELLEENGGSGADAIPDNVHAPEESAESKYENEGRSHTLAPVDAHESTKTSSSDVSLVFSRGDSSEYQEKPASSVMEPEQDTEEQKNEDMDMNDMKAVDMNSDCLNENLSSHMTVASAQSLEPGAVLNLDTSEMPLAPSAGENLNTTDLLDVDKHAMSAVQDFKGTEAAGTTLEISEPLCQGTQAQTLGVVCAPETSNKHFMTDLGTNSLLESKEDKSVPVEAQHTEIPSKESPKEGQSTGVSSKRASQSASFEQPKSDCSGPLHKSLEREAIKHSVMLSNEATGLNKNRTGHPSQREAGAGISVKNTSVLKLEACCASASSKLDSTSAALHQKHQTVGEKDDAKRTPGFAVENEKSESLQVSTSAEIGLQFKDKDTYFNIHSLSAAPEELPQTICSVSANNIDKPDEESTLDAHEGQTEILDKNITELGQKSLKSETSKVQPAAGILSNNAITDCEQEKAHLAEKDNLLTKIDEFMKGSSESSLDHQTKSSSKCQHSKEGFEHAAPLDGIGGLQELHHDEHQGKGACERSDMGREVLNRNTQEQAEDVQTIVIDDDITSVSGSSFQNKGKALHEMPKKQKKKVTLIRVTKSHAERKLQSPTNNDCHKASQESMSGTVQEAPLDATALPQASSKLDTDQSKLRKETSDSIGMLPHKPAEDSIEMRISRCQPSKEGFEHAAPPDGIGGLQELHHDEHQGKGACERDDMGRKVLNRNIQEQAEDVQTIVIDDDDTSVPGSSFQNLMCSLKTKGVNCEGTSTAEPPTDKLLAALHLVPRPLDSKEPSPPLEEQDLTAEEPCPGPSTSKLGDGENKPYSECLDEQDDEQDDDNLSKKRWSLRTPTKPRKRVIIPDSDDEDFEAYVSEDVPPTTQKSKSEEAFDVLLDFFKKEQAQKAATETTTETATTRKRSPKKVGRPPSKGTSAHSSVANSVPSEKESTVKTAKVKDIVKPTARKSQPVHTPGTASQGAAVKRAQKRRSELVKGVPSKKTVGDSGRIPSVNDTFAGDIRIRCQKPSSSQDKMTARYHCSKCGFRSARMENIVRHHKQDCPYSKTQPAWDSKALKSTNRALT